MTIPLVPSLGSGVRTVFGVAFRRLWRGKRLRVALVAVFFVLVAIIAIRYSPTSYYEPTELVARGILMGVFSLLALVVPFILTTGIVGEEIRARTLPFLLMRPVSRTAIGLGKILAAFVLSVGLLLGSLFILHIAVYLTDGGLLVEELPNTLRMAAALILLAALYCSVCAFWGSIIPEFGGLVSGIYLAILEFAIGFLPFVYRFGSMNYLASQFAGLPKLGLNPDGVPEVDVWVPPVVIVTEIAFFLGFALLSLSSTEFKYGKA